MALRASIIDFANDVDLQISRRNFKMLGVSEIFVTALESVSTSSDHGRGSWHGLYSARWRVGEIGRRCIDARLSTTKRQRAPQSARCDQGVASGSWVLGTRPTRTGTSHCHRHGGYPRRIIRNCSLATDDGRASDEQHKEPERAPGLGFPAGKSLRSRG